MLRSRSPLAALALAAVLLVPATAGAKRPASRAAQAATIAKAVTKAKTDKARRAAVLRALKLAGVGVYSGRGRAIQRGAERTARDPFLYSFELTGLVTELRRKQRTTFAEVVTRLQQVGLRRRGGKTLTASRLAAAVAKAVRTARKHPRSARGSGALLVGAIALRRHGRLTSKAKLDALQAWIVEAEIIGRARRAGKASMLRRARAAAAKPCFSGQRRAGKAVKGLGGIADAVDDVAKFAVNVVAQPLHMAGIALAVEMTAPPAEQVTSTHYGPVGHGGTPNAGRKLVFTVEVRMLAEPPETLIRCGPLAGLKLPHKGPIADVPINWDGIVSDGIATLERHGRIVQQDAATDRGGSAALVFEPKDEVVPSKGKVVVAAGALQPEAEVWTALGNDLGNLPEAVGVKSATIGFSVLRHAPRGFRFDVLQDLTWTDSQGKRHPQWHRWQGRKCGEDPYTGVWAGAEDSFHDAYTDAPQQGHKINWTIGPDGSPRYAYQHEAWSPSPATYWYAFRIPRDSGRLEVTTNATAYDEVETVTGPLSEDPACPQPK
jgi:hypothetical protein